LLPGSRTPDEARRTLLEALREHSLVIGEVTLSSGRTAQYYVDVRRTLLRPEPFRAAGVLVSEQAARLGAGAVGGPVMGAVPIACAAIGAAGDGELQAFFVRKDRKEHGLQRWVEGPEIAPGTGALVVEDTVTTGGSVIEAIERLKEEGIALAGALAIVDRLAGGEHAIQSALGGGLPYRPLFTIDDLYPERPDR
jgi:orotate phosphoribosyltransferase